MLTVALMLAGILGAAPPTLSTPPLPLAPPPETARPPRADEPEILYVNYDGALLQSGCGNDARFDCSTLAGLFDGYVGPFNGSLNQRLAILQATRSAVAEFGVRVVAVRPPDDVDYTMVVYGDLGPQDFAGVAPYIDCEDLHPRDTSFTGAFTGSNTGSTVILQEAAHTWGLEHVDNEFDVLNPFKASGIRQNFLDQCSPIVANTALEPTPGSCNQIHTQFCDPGFQNSFQEMLLLFGPHVPDVEPPTVEVTYPPDGSTFVFPASFSLFGEVSDNLHPQFYTVDVIQDGTTLLSDTVAGLDLRLTRPPQGEYDLLIRITDEEGNTAEDRVRFTILPEGSELDIEDPLQVDPEAEDDTEGCSILAAPPRPALPTLAGLWVLWIAGRRRGPA